MASISRRSVLDAILITVLLATLPRAIFRIIQTGDLYLLTGHFFHDVLARLSGPGRLRFIVQPLVAMVLGIRNGMQDAHEGLPPFLWALVFDKVRRRQLAGSAFSAIRSMVTIAILLDIIAQFLIFHEVRPGAALLVGPVLIALPYALTRAVANRFARRHSHVRALQRN